MKSLWTIAIILLLMAGGSRAARTRHTEVPTTPPSRSTALRLRMAWRVTERTIGTLAALLALGLTAYQMIGPFWPTPPDIESQDASDGSSALLPFKVSSKNHIFPVKNVSLSCYNNLIFVMDADRKMILLRDSMLQGGTAAFGVGINYSCDAEMLKIRPDGSLLMGIEGGTNLATNSGIFRGPLTILKLCVAVVGTYEDWRGVWRRLPNMMFQWPAAPGAHQWIKGPVVFEADPERWVPPDRYMGIGLWPETLV